MNKNKTVLAVFAVGIACNLLLFLTKLYVGLRVNSVCIWSDAINNLADALSCVISLSFLAVTIRLGKGGILRAVTKAQQLLSFVLAIIVAAVGFSFAYSSLERFMYPTPIWFSMKYFYIVLATALAKLAMFFFYRGFAKKTGSPVIRVLQHDSILDFFITLTTLLSFALTQFASFAIDAVFGLVISVVIIINAAKMIREYTGALLGWVPKETRAQVETLLQADNSITSLGSIRYEIGEQAEVIATVKAQFSPSLSREALTAQAAALTEQCLEQTGVKLSFLL